MRTFDFGFSLEASGTLSVLATFRASRICQLAKPFPARGGWSDRRKHGMQTSLSRCNSKLRITSSRDLPVGSTDGLNRQPHSEQPKPAKRFCSIHTSVRLMVAYVAASQRVPACRRGTKRSGSPLDDSFRSGVPEIAAESCHLVWARRKMHIRDGRILNAPGGMVCRTSYIHGRLCSCEGLL
jgi:hypothetical protein